jgi:hypothetical protein
MVIMLKLIQGKEAKLCEEIYLQTSIIIEASILIQSLGVVRRVCKEKWAAQSLIIGEKLRSFAQYYSIVKVNQQSISQDLQALCTSRPRTSLVMGFRVLVLVMGP